MIITWIIVNYKVIACSGKDFRAGILRVKWFGYIGNTFCLIKKTMQC